MTTEEKLEKVLAYIENRDKVLQMRVRDLRNNRMYDLAEKYDHARVELEGIRSLIEEDD